MRKLIIDLFAFAVLAFGAFVLVSGIGAKPERKDRTPAPKAEAKQAIPDLAGESRWGFITQKGRAISITGHDQWEASGEIRKDGKLFVTWILTGTERAGPALYTINPDGSITGHWNYSDRVMIDKDGVIQGLTQPDTLRAAAKPEL